MKNVFKLLIVQLILGCPLIAFAQHSFDAEQVAKKVAFYKSDIRGPYKQIRWFCEDGSVRPKTPALMAVSSTPRTKTMWWS